MNNGDHLGGKRLRIGLYVDVAKESEPRGVGYHVLHLLHALSELDTVNEYLLYFQCGVFEGTNIFKHAPAANNFRLRPVRFPYGWTGSHPTLWWNYYLPWLIDRDRIDVFHCPNHFLPQLRRAKTVVTIHDIAYFTMELYSEGMTHALRTWTKRALEQATGVIAISQNTRADLVSLGVEPSKISLIYGGGHIIDDDSIQFDRGEEVRRQYGLPEKYIVFVGTLGLRKNLPFLIRGYAQLKKDTNLPHKLVLVGKKYAGMEDLEKLIHELEIERDVIITGYVEEWQVPLLYKMADVFVLPTLYEGFTLVTLEAMAYGIPVISTDTSSIREGVGDAGVLVPLNDVPALTSAMAKVLQDHEFRAELVRRGKQQAQKFTWRECARQTLDLYHEVVNGG